MCVCLRTPERARAGHLWNSMKGKVRERVCEYESVRKRKRERERERERESMRVQECVSVCPSVCVCAHVCTSVRVHVRYCQYFVSRPKIMTVFRLLDKVSYWLRRLGTINTFPGTIISPMSFLIGCTLRSCGDFPHLLFVYIEQCLLLCHPKMPSLITTSI